MMTLGALIPAAGSGVRLGVGGPKALHPVGGVPMLLRTLTALATAGIVERLVVAAPPDEVPEVRRLVTALPITVLVVPGGASRVDSVRLALEALPPQVAAVLVHDAARPFAPPSLVTAVARALADGAEAVVPVLPLVDTVKLVDAAGQVVRTLDRSMLRAAQTPQGFRTDLLRRAHANSAAAAATDDAALVEAVGGRIVTVPGHPEAFKITTRLDLLLAEACARRTAGSVAAHVG